MSESLVEELTEAIEWMKADEAYWEQFEKDLARERRCVHDQDQINMHSACRGPVVMDTFYKEA